MTYTAYTDADSQAVTSPSACTEAYTESLLVGYLWDFVAHRFKKVGYLRDFVAHRFKKVGYLRDFVAHKFQKVRY